MISSRKVSGIATLQCTESRELERQTVNTSQSKIWQYEEWQNEKEEGLKQTLTSVTLQAVSGLQGAGNFSGIRETAQNDECSKKSKKGQLGGSDG